MTPPPGFSTPPHIPNINTSERPPVTTTVFVATTPENTPFAYRASTSANPNHTISPTFVETNYKVLESLLRERRRQIRNKDLRTELEYFSEDYDEVREMEPRPGPTRETTPPLLPRSLGVRRQRERVVGFEEDSNREGSGAGRNAKANLGRNENVQPLQSSLIFVYEGHQPTTNTGGGIALLTAQNGNPSAGGTFAYHSQGRYIPQTFMNNGIPSYNGSMYPVVTPLSNYPFYTQPMYAPPNMPMYPNPAGFLVDSTGSITPFVCWIKDYPLPDGLKMTFHIGYYNEKGDPDNFLHLFEGVIRMQKWLMLVACHMFTYILKYSARIWWNSQKAAIYNIKQREGESTKAFATRYTDDTLQILGLHEDQRISGFVHGLRTRSLVEHLSTDLLSTYKGLMEKTYTWIEAREDRKAGIGSPPIEDLIMDCFSSLSKIPREILPQKSQIEEAVKLGQPSHLMKEIKKERANTSENQRVEGKKDKGTTPTEASILMIRQWESYTRDNTSEDFISKGRKLKFLLVTRGSNSSALVIITAKIFGKEVGQVHMHSGSSCKVIYEHCFMKLKPSIRASKIDSKVPIIRFSGEKSWSSEEIPLEITIGDPPLARRETLNFVIIKSDSPYNMLLGRKTMQKIRHAYKVYHQIQMAEADEDKTSFFAGEGVFYYQKMPFGLKNAGATYQRLVYKVFHDQIGRNLEAYIDDMVIKITSEEDMLANIKETFERCNQGLKGLNTSVIARFGTKPTGSHMSSVLRMSGQRSATSSSGLPLSELGLGVTRGARLTRVFLLRWYILPSVTEGVNEVPGKLARRFSDQGKRTPYKGNRPPRTGHEGGHQRADNYNANSCRDHYQPYVSPRYNRRQLEATLESDKLSHLVKDVRQRGNNRGIHQGNNSTNEKIINMMRVRGENCKQVEVEGYLVRRVFVDQGVAIQDKARMSIFLNYNLS
nr:hypothetical protein [Tanacetum cinerariifolium]